MSAVRAPQSNPATTAVVTPIASRKSIASTASAAGSPLRTAASSRKRSSRTHAGAARARGIRRRRAGGRRRRTRGCRTAIRGGAVPRARRPAPPRRNRRSARRRRPDGHHRSQTWRPFEGNGAPSVFRRPDVRLLRRSAGSGVDAHGECHLVARGGVAGHGRQLPRAAVIAEDVVAVRRHLRQVLSSNPHNPRRVDPVAGVLGQRDLRGRDGLAGVGDAA